MNRSTAPSTEDFIRAVIREVERRLSQEGILAGGDSSLCCACGSEEYNRLPLD